MGKNNLLHISEYNYSMKDFFAIFPKSIRENFTASWDIPQREACYEPIPDDLSENAKEIFRSIGIDQLYKHQAESLRFTFSGKNVAIVTGTGSGKSLCYQMPLLDSIISNENNTSLLLFPTKALSADQYKKLKNILEATYKKIPFLSERISIGIYDGDTTKSQRVSIRNNSNLLITNPDMLHIGILPHHPAWSRYFTNLKYIVIDEIHIYKGVFGSHFTNLIRRLKRIITFYGSTPQFILTSATIGNPKELAEKIIEEKVSLIQNDYSKQNAKSFTFYNPPVINIELGLRKSMREETYQIAKTLRSNNIQSIIFARSRDSVEQLLIKFNIKANQLKQTVSAYRSGFLKSERREIEAGLRSRRLELVISTTALELGIDIGTVEAILLMGYPGSIARFLQQAGRAGRDKNNSLCLMIASASPLDQFFIRHPEFIKGKSPEMVLIDSNNPFILFHHLKCAAFELPFDLGENFGLIHWNDICQYFSILEKAGLLYKSSDKYFWKSDQYPANQISLRSISGTPIILLTIENGITKRIGEMDQKSAKKKIFPGAIYLHNGQSFLIEKLNLDKQIANLSISKEDYYTAPIVHVSTVIEKQMDSSDRGAYIKGFGEIDIEEKVVGFNKFSWDTNELLGNQGLDMESDNLQTKGVWISFSNEIIRKLIELNLWTNNKNNYGSNWEKIRKKIIQRDNSKCQICGFTTSQNALHVHHIKPFRTFSKISHANLESNLVSLCPNCHKAAEKNIRMRSILSGITYSFSHIAPLFLNCDIHDLGYTFEERIGIQKKKPGIIIFDQFPGGIGLSENLFLKIEMLFNSLKEIVKICPCFDGCPSCIGPPGENGVGAKQGVLELANAINV